MMLSTAKIKEMSTARLIITPNTLCLDSHLPCCSFQGKIHLISKIAYYPSFTVWILLFWQSAAHTKKT